MKKLLFFLLLLVVSIAGRAQVELLTHKDIKGDPMLGTKDFSAWVGNNVLIKEISDDDATIILTNKGTYHIFVKGYMSIGYYNNNDELILHTKILITDRKIAQDHQRVWFDSYLTKDSIPYSERSEYKFGGDITYHAKASHVMKWLRENDGYVRMVAPMYGGNSLDVRFALRKKQE